MSQAIAGVTPPGAQEATIMVVWPSVASLSLGRTLGGLLSNRAGFGNILTVGNLLALATIPLGIVLYFITKWQRYRLTNRRVVVERGPSLKVDRSVPLDNFDSIEVVVLPGQQWYQAGDLIFRNGKIETLRLSGVPRPETFRHTCLKARHAYVYVEKACTAQAAMA